ncbi:PE-PGRS family protein, partial [Micromonospora globispora]
MSTPSQGSTGTWCSGESTGGAGVGSADSPQARLRGSGGGTGAEPLHRGAGGSGRVSTFVGSGRDSTFVGSGEPAGGT